MEGVEAERRAVGACTLHGPPRSWLPAGSCAAPLAPRVHLIALPVLTRSQSCHSYPPSQGAFRAGLTASVACVFCIFFLWPTSGEAAEGHGKPHAQRARGRP